jgi:hypothetical protein
MLKIKDGINLRVLLSYGFKTKYDEDTGLAYKYQHKEYEFVYVILKNRELNLSESNVRFEERHKYYSLMFDLINDGLVEKV